MSTTLPVKIVPGASQSEIAGWLGQELKIRVSAPPEKGKANQNVERLLAKHLNLAPKQVKIIKGHHSAHKIVEFQGITQATLSTTFGQPGSPSALTSTASSRCVC